MALAPGTKLGPYEVLAPLGAGGMGEVFRARDTRLGRDVAVKVLPDHLAGDPKALHRFETRRRPSPPSRTRTSSPSLDVGEIERHPLRRHRAARGRDPARDPEFEELLKPKG